MSDESPLSFLRMTPEDRQRVMEENPPTCHGVHAANVYFDWDWKGCGFGQLSFSLKDGVWSCDTETMGPESTRKFLHAFADYVADQLTPIILAERAEWETRQNLAG